MLNIARDRRKTLKKEKKTRKIRKSKTATVSIVLLLLFYAEKIIFLRQHIWKSFVCIVTFILDLYYFLKWQVVGYVVMKRQGPYRYALVL